MESNSVLKPAAASNRMPLIVGVGIVVVLVGLGTGWLISSKKTVLNKTSGAASDIVHTQTGAGAKDASAFKDTATGTLQTGGIKGEGTYHLDRSGGANKTVYLNSTVIDMSTFVGKKVQVWGETVVSKNAPWLMDVGKIQVVE